MNAIKSESTFESYQIPNPQLIQTRRIVETFQSLK